MVLDQSSEAMEYRVQEMIMLQMFFSSALGVGLVVDVEDCLRGADWSIDSEDGDDIFGRGRIGLVFDFAEESKREKCIVSVDRMFAG